MAARSKFDVSIRPHEVSILDDAARIDVRVATEGDLSAWQRFVDQNPNAGCMHHAGWYGVLRDAFWVRPYFLVAETHAKQIVGILPLYHSRSPLTGSHLSSVEEGVLALPGNAAAALLVRARSLRDEIGAKYLQIRGGAIDQPGSKSFNSLHTFIDTSRPRESLWQAIKKQTRWAIRQAQKSEIRIEHDAVLANLGQFHTVYTEHMHCLGTPAPGADTFLALRSHLGTARLRLYLVKERQRIIGGMLCILNQHRWTDYYAIVRPTGQTDFANYLLYWHVISDAAASGARLLDLGRSAPNSNVHLFKRKWGGYDVEVTYHFYSSANCGSGNVGLEELKQGKGLPQWLWSHLPLTACNLLGPFLRKQLPFI
jgi:Acetyltransferase (GNAT) domain